MMHLKKATVRPCRFIAVSSLISLLATSLVISCGIAADHATTPSFREDFYRASNAAWFSDNRKIPPGYAAWNQFSEIIVNNRKTQIAMLEDFSRAPRREGSSEQRLADLYASVLRMEDRNALGYEPVRPYLDAYRNAKTLHELIDADMKCFEELGRSFLLVFSVNSMSRGVPSVSHNGPLPLEHVTYRQGNYSNPYSVYLSRLFVLSGSSAADENKKPE